MARKPLHLYIYSIRNTAALRVYRSTRNPKFLVKVRTLGAGIEVTK